jgi:hypothetical protein
MRVLQWKAFKMRDIRDDLKERLDGIEARRLRLRDVLKDLDAEATVINQLLLFENQRRHVPGPLSGGVYISAGDQRLQPVADFITDLLRAGGPLSKNNIRLKCEDAGYFKGEEATGRVVHATLMNLMRHGRIRLRENGLYEIIGVGVRPLSDTEMKLPEGVRERR